MAISCWPKRYGRDLNHLRARHSGRYSPFAAAIVAVKVFSGLLSSAWAFASAVAPMVSLERCIGGLQKFEADRSGFGALGSQPIPDSLFGVVRHQRFQFDLGILVFEKSIPGFPELSGKFRPRVG